MAEQPGQLRPEAVAQQVQRQKRPFATRGEQYGLVIASPVNQVRLKATQ